MEFKIKKKSYRKKSVRKNNLQSRGYASSFIYILYSRIWKLSCDLERKGRVSFLDQLQWASLPLLGVECQSQWASLPLLRLGNQSQRASPPLLCLVVPITAHHFLNPLQHPSKNHFSHILTNSKRNWSTSLLRSNFKGVIILFSLCGEVRLSRLSFRFQISKYHFFLKKWWFQKIIPRQEIKQKKLNIPMINVDTVFSILVHFSIRIFYV